METSPHCQHDGTQSILFFKPFHVCFSIDMSGAAADTNTVDEPKFWRNLPDQTDLISFVLKHFPDIFSCGPTAVCTNLDHKAFVN